MPPAENTDRTSNALSVSNAGLTELAGDTSAALRAASRRFRHENKPLWQIATLNKLVEKEPDDAHAFYELGFALLNLDKHDAALAAFGRMLSRP